MSKNIEKVMAPLPLWKGVWIFLLYGSQLLDRSTSLIISRPPSCNSLRCIYVYEPVCGNDNRTYPNLCFLFMESCVNPQVAYSRPGPCVLPDPCEIPCNRIYSPVCGNDGQTYTNPCVLMYFSCLYISRGLEAAYNGRCESNPPSSSSGGNRPGVAQRPRTTARTTTTTTTTTIAPGPWRNTTCPVGCTREYLPVCGSDSVTYANECTLRSVSCRDSSIRKINDGPCNEQPILPPEEASESCPLSCNRIYNPVCASNGETYTNFCVYTLARCIDNSLNFIRNGPCGPEPRPSGQLQPRRTTTTTSTTVRPRRPPVFFQTTSSTTTTPATTTRRNAFFTTPATITNREFCRKDCPFTFAPICGTDGVTYTNKCTFDVAVCMSDGAVKVDYNGLCA